MSAAHQQSQWSSAFLGALVSGGVTHMVVAPGSRHTPLVLAAHHLANAGKITLHDVLDERVAGFVALGLSRVTGSPCVVITTSGTAGAHLLPAVIEAERSRIPMVLATADRPAALQGVGAPQTIDQRALYGVHVRSCFTVEPMEDPEAIAQATHLAGQVLDEAMGEEPGPVHLNAAFRKPLWEPGSDTGHAVDVAGAHLERTPRRCAPDPDRLDELVDAIEQSERGLLYLGPGDPGWAGATYDVRRDAVARAALALADRLGWPVVADGGSAGRLAGAHAAWITSMESLVRSGTLDAVHPDLVIRIGQVATSTANQTWLGSRQSRSISMDPTGRRQDPTGVCEPPLRGESSLVLERLAHGVAAREHGEWTRWWREAERHARGCLDALTSSDDSWSGASLRAVLDRAPEGALLHVASSLPIRDLDAFSGAPRRRIHLAVNRGANGIDGLVSTALGEALAWPRPVVALLGDLALVHDLGGLVAARKALEGTGGGSLTLVVIDNGGGAIFDALPIAEHPTAHETHFIANQGADLAALARGAGVDAHALDGTYDAVSSILSEVIERPGVRLLHVKVDRRRDAARRREVHEAVSRALDANALPSSTPGGAS